jgi:hypothetical protein
MSRRGSVSLFSLLSLSQEAEDSLAHTFAGGEDEDMDRALIQGSSALPGGKQWQGDLAGEQ